MSVHACSVDVESIGQWWRKGGGNASQVSGYLYQIIQDNKLC